MLSTFTDLKNEVAAELRPVTALERWFASEVAYATWELEQVRANSANIEAASALSAAYNRATRNWNRARKGLNTVQTVRVGHTTRLTAKQQEIAAATPLANVSRVPSLKRATVGFVEEALSAMDPGVLNLIREQGRR